MRWFFTGLGVKSLRDLFGGGRKISHHLAVQAALRFRACENSHRGRLTREGEHLPKHGVDLVRGGCCHDPITQAYRIPGVHVFSLSKSELIHNMKSMIVVLFLNYGVTKTLRTKTPCLTVIVVNFLGLYQRSFEA